MWNQYPKPGNHGDVEKYHSVFKMSPRRLSHQRNQGGKTSAVARSCGQFVSRMVTGTNGHRVPWFFTITPLLGTIASWGFGVKHPPFFWTRDKSGGQKALEQNGTTKQGSPQSLGFLCVQWPTLIIIVWNFFLSYEELSFLVFCQNQTCCLSRVCCKCDSWGRGNWRTKDASSANCSRRSRRAWLKSASTRQHRPPVFSTSPFFFLPPSLLPL